MSGKLKCTNIDIIGEELLEKHNFTHDQVCNIKFTDLQKFIIELDEFGDIVTNCNEKILEAIQAYMLAELED